jgi:BlaI family transcriptional regulator, penicillinase repressor
MKVNDIRHKSDSNMARKRKPVRLSSGELEIVSMLWEHGPLTVAEAHATFARTVRPLAYPTMQTRLNRLADKGYLRRTDRRPAQYEAAITAEQVSAGHLRQILDAIGRQKLVPLVAHLIAERSLSPAEINHLKRLLAEAESETSARQAKPGEKS